MLSLGRWWHRTTGGFCLAFDLDTQHLGVQTVRLYFSGGLELPRSCCGIPRFVLLELKA